MQGNNYGIIDSLSKKKLHVGDLVLLYDRKFIQHPGKLCMHWLGSYVIEEVIELGVAQLETLNRK